MHMNSSLKWTIPVLLVFAIAACNSEESTPTVTADEQTDSAVEAPVTEIKEVKEDATMTLSGQIEFKPFEGGFYAFIGDDGSKWVLHGLDKQYHRHALRLTVTGTPMPDMMTTTQFGTVMQVESISNVDESGVTKRPASPDEM